MANRYAERALQQVRGTSTPASGPATRSTLGRSAINSVRPKPAPVEPEEDKSWVEKYAPTIARIGLPLLGAGIGSVVPVAGTAAGAGIGAAIGGAIGGGLGEAAAEKLEGRDLDAKEIALSAGLSAIPAGPAGRMAGKLATEAAKTGVSNLGRRAALHAVEGAAQGALAETVSPVVREGRAPTMGEIGRGAAFGTVLGGALGTGVDLGGNALVRRPVDAPPVDAPAPVVDAPPVGPVEPVPPPLPREWEGAPPPEFAPADVIMPRTPAEVAADQLRAKGIPETWRTVRRPDELLSDVAPLPDLGPSPSAGFARGGRPVEKAPPLVAEQPLQEPGVAFTEQTPLPRDGDRRVATEPVGFMDRRFSTRRAELVEKYGEHPAIDETIAAERDARTDPLTGLWNKRAWEEMKATAGPADHFLMIDNKRFKPVNDKFGHGAGDMILKRTAQVVREVLGGESARFGGDEFGGLVRNATPEMLDSLEAEVMKRVADSPMTLRNPVTGESLDIPGFEVHIARGANADAADIAVNEVAKASRAGGRGDVPITGDPNLNRPVETTPGPLGSGVGDRPAVAPGGAAPDPPQTTVPKRFDREAAMQRLYSRGSQANDLGSAAAQGAGVLQDLAEIGASYVEEYAQRNKGKLVAFDSWARAAFKALKDVVPNVRKYLRQIYDESVGLWNKTGITFGALPNEPRGVVMGSLGGALQPPGGRYNAGVDAKAPEWLVGAHSLGAELREAYPGVPPSQAVAQAAYDPRFESRLAEIYTGTQAEQNASNAFLMEGLRGEPLPRRVRAWRHGEIPDGGESRNWRDDRSEGGLSVMGVEGEGNFALPEYERLGGGYVNRPRVDVEGFLISGRGSDGEPLIVWPRRVETPPAKKRRTGGAGPARFTGVPEDGIVPKFAPKSGAYAGAQRGAFPDLPGASPSMPPPPKMPKAKAEPTSPQPLPPGTVVKGMEPDVPKAPEPEPLGRPMVEGEAPRVEAKVDQLREADPKAKLSRDTKRSWESLDPQIRQKLDDVTANPEKEAALYERARAGKVDDVDVQALDALVAGKRQKYDEARQQLLKAQAEGKDSGPDSVQYLSAALDEVAADLARAARSDVEAGTKLARALAARARVMQAKVSATDPDTFLRRVFREIPDVSDKQAAELVRVLREQPHRLGDALHAAMTPRKVDKWLEAWKAGLVSAPGTQIANLAGNVGEQEIRVGETAIAAVLDSLIGGPRTRMAGEAGWELAGQLAGARRGFGNLRQALRDIVTLAPEKIDLTQPLERQVGAIGGKTGRAVRIPFRLLSAFDDMFKSIGGEAELYKRAYRAAKGDTAKAEKLIARDADGVPALLSEVSGVGDEIKANVLERVFQDPQKMANVIQSARNQYKLLHAVVPFAQTPTSIFSRTLERSPFGAVAGLKAYRAYKSAVASGADAATIAKLKGEAVDKLARPVAGTLILGAFAGLAKAGGMTGGGPTDPKDRNALRDSGWQPYSFKATVNGKAYYIPYNRFEPVSSLLGFAADMVEAGDAKQSGDLFDKALGSVAQNLTSKTYLQGLADAAEAINNPKQFMGQYVTNLAGSMVPNIVAKGAQAIDPTFRDVRPEDSGIGGIPERIGKTIASRIPGLSTTLPERRSGTGEVIERAGSAVTRLLSPVQPSADKEGGDFNRFLVDIDAVPSAPGRDLVVKGKRVRLSEEEYRAIQDADEKTTASLRRSLPRLMKTDPEKARNVIRSAYDQARATARRRVMVSPGFRTRAREVAK